MYSLINPRFVIDENKAVLALVREGEGEHSQYFLLTEHHAGLGRVRYCRYHIQLDQSKNKVVDNFEAVPERLAAITFNNNFLQGKKLLAKTWSISSADSKFTGLRGREVASKNSSVHPEFSFFRSVLDDIKVESLPNSPEELTAELQLAFIKPSVELRSSVPVFGLSADGEDYDLVLRNLCPPAHLANHQLYDFGKIPSHTVAYHVTDGAFSTLSVDEIISILQKLPSHITSLSFKNNGLGLRSTADWVKILSNLPPQIDTVDLSHCILGRRPPSEFRQIIAALPNHVRWLLLEDETISKSSPDLQERFGTAPVGLTIKLSNIETIDVKSYRKTAVQEEKLFKEVRRLKDAEQSYTERFLVFLGLLLPAKAKIDALTRLMTILCTQESKDLAVGIDSWKGDFQAEVKTSRNWMHQFFAPHIPQSQVVLDEVLRALSPGNGIC